MPAHYLWRGVSKQSLRTAIPTLDNSVEPITDNGIIGRLDNRAQPVRSSFNPFDTPPDRQSQRDASERQQSRASNGPP